MIRINKTQRWECFPKKKDTKCDMLYQSDVRVNWSVSHPRLFVHRGNIIAAAYLSISLLLYVYSADIDLHICSISSDVVNTAATGAIATLDSIYDTSNIGPSLRSITLDSGTMVSLRNRSYSALHPRDSRISRTNFRVKLSRLVWERNEKYSRRIIHPLRNRENIDVRSFIRYSRFGIRNGARGFALIRGSYNAITQRASWLGIICDSHWDNEPFVAGVN